MNNVIRSDIEAIAALSLPWRRLAGKTVLITGASGFIASYLVHVLIHLNRIKALPQPVRVLAGVRNVDGAKVRFNDYLKDDDFEIIEQDVSKPLDSNLPKIDFLIHAASQATPKYYGSDPVGTLEANVVGTRSLLQIARIHDVEQFLCFSSSEVYGAILDQSGIASEHDFGFLDPTSVRSCYAESKRMAETMCVSWKHQYGVPVSIVRPFHTYGPGMALDDGRIFADLTANVVRNENITLNSDGSAIRAYCYLSDAIAGYFHVLFSGLSGEAYNVGNDLETYSVAELAQLLKQTFPEKNIAVVRRALPSNDGGYIQSPISKIVPNVDKLRGLGWRPTVSAAEGFKRTVKSFQDNSGKGIQDEV